MNVSPVGREQFVRNAGPPQYRGVRIDRDAGIPSGVVGYSRVFKHRFTFEWLRLDTIIWWALRCVEFARSALGQFKALAKRQSVKRIASDQRAIRLDAGNRACRPP